MRRGKLAATTSEWPTPTRPPRWAARSPLETGLIARSWQELFANLIEQLRLQKALIGVVVFLIVLVAAMGIANLLILTVAEKTEEIAILRAMGASQRQILSVFVVEGFVLGGVGTLARRAARLRHQPVLQAQTVSAAGRPVLHHATAGSNASVRLRLGLCVVAVDQYRCGARSGAAGECPEPGRYRALSPFPN